MSKRLFWLFVAVIFLTASVGAKQNVVMKEISSDQIAVYIKDTHFTTWNCSAKLNGFYLNKPVLWPVLTSKGTPVTRDYPFRQGRVKENRDHAHHQGIFFTYGLLNYGEEEQINIWNIYRPEGNYPPHGGGRYGKSPGKIIFRKNLKTVRRSCETPNPASQTLKLFRYKCPYAGVIIDKKHIILFYFYLHCILLKLTAH